tara:strand:+ start:267 stop:473 length:207 start_codon:yes stop_codon:yes gene_type:complete
MIHRGSRVKFLERTMRVVVGISADQLITRLMLDALEESEEQALEILREVHTNTETQQLRQEIQERYKS